MIKSKKQMILVISVFALVMLLGTVTYAFFNYTRTGVSNTIKVGRISFVTRQTETINLTNIFPITSSEATGENPNYDQVVIEIEGDTDYSGGIEYLVSAVDANIYTTKGQIVPISLDITIDNDLGTENNNYFTARDNTNTSIYKKLVGDTLAGDQMLLVGYIAPNSPGNIDGIDGTITIKAYLDKDKIKISDTYDGTESDNMGTTNEWIEGKTVITTNEWNALQQNGVSFKVKVEANEGIWVIGSLEEIMRKNNIGIDTENGVDFSKSSNIDGGYMRAGTKGVYLRNGTESDEYPIMYYRGAVTDNNVIFGGFCWKIVRTTDTGGVKLLYNGLPGDVYGGDEVPLTEDQYIIPAGETNDFTFNSTDNSWEITITDNGTKEITFNVARKTYYRFVQTGISGSSSGGTWYLYKNGSSYKYASNGGGNPMNDNYTFNYILNPTDVIKWSFSGSASVESPITFKLQMYAPGDLMPGSGCENFDESTILNVDRTGTYPSAFNISAKSPAYVGYMYGTVYESSTANWTSGARFGSSFTWDGTNYKLVDATQTSPNSTHHYSCNVTTENGTCTELRYVYYVNGSTKYYITLTGGDGVEEALVKMQTNTTNSNAKDIIDEWYSANMTSYTDKLEDTIWCNDRSIALANGWSPTGEWGTSNYKQYSLIYGTTERSNFASDTSTEKNQPSLACTNKNDRFTVNNANGNQSLDYPVALLTEDEMVLAGGFTNMINAGYLYNGSSGSSSYWSMSPYYSDGNLGSMFNFGSGYVGGIYVMYNNGYRPAISLKPGQLITSGTGTESNPYVIE